MIDVEPLITKLLPYFIGAFFALVSIPIIEMLCEILEYSYKYVTHKSHTVIGLKILEQLKNKDLWIIINPNNNIYNSLIKTDGSVKIYPRLKELLEIKNADITSFLNRHDKRQIRKISKILIKEKTVEHKVKTIDQVLKSIT